ncbi:hypothetical protein [Bradyrhizobium sp. LB13.1]
METVSGEPMFTNVARHVSQERTQHWKSADDWLAYNKEFDRHNPTDAWLNSVNKSADHYALMKVFGSKPKENFEEIIAYAKNVAMGNTNVTTTSTINQSAELTLESGQIFVETQGSFGSTTTACYGWTDNI